MKFIVSDSDAASRRLATALSNALATHDHVLWIVSGGSNVGLAKRAFDSLSAIEQAKLTIALADERFVPVGHADSNYEKYRVAGFLTPSTMFLPILQEGLDLTGTTQAYDETLRQLFKAADFVIAQLGIGADGHTAGILPESPAVDSTGLATSYTGFDFKRVTMTFEALRHADLTLVFAFGPDKTAALTRLLTKDLGLDEQPSQIFKQIESVEIYNDSIEGDI